MKKFAAVGIVAVLLTVGSYNVVNSQEPAIKPPEKVNTTPGMLTNMIDDINVPWEILEYVQMKYEGHAVTKADKVKRNNTELYRLRVDRDSEATDYDSIALLFDMQWRLVGEEKYASPPPRPVAVPDKKEPEQPREQRDEGGRGGGDEDSSGGGSDDKPDDTPVAPQPQPTPEPTPEPEPTPADGDSSGGED